MKTIITCLLIALGVMWGCESSTYTFVSTITKDLEYTVGKEGNFSESYSLYANDFNDDLDLPEDATIGGVYIESFAIEAEPQPDNEASAVKINCYAGTETQPFAQDVVLPVDLSFSLASMPGLVSSGISSLRNELEGFVIDSDPQSIAFRIEGDSDPDPGERISVVVTIHVTITVAYDVENELIGF